MLTAEQRLRQALVKRRIKSARQVRDVNAGRSHVISGCDDRTMWLDAIRRAYEAGKREAKEDA